MNINIRDYSFLLIDQSTTDIRYKVLVMCDGDFVDELFIWHNHYDKDDWGYEFCGPVSYTLNGLLEDIIESCNK